MQQQDVRVVDVEHAAHDVPGTVDDRIARDMHAGHGFHHFIKVYRPHGLDVFGGDDRGDGRRTAQRLHRARGDADRARVAVELQQLLLGCLLAEGRTCAGQHYHPKGHLGR